MTVSDFCCQSEAKTIIPSSFVDLINYILPPTGKKCKEDLWNMSNDMEQNEFFGKVVWQILLKLWVLKIRVILFPKF